MDQSTAVDNRKISCDISMPLNIYKNSDCIIELPLCELHPPDFHPFEVKDDNAMNRLVESVKRYGVREPGLVRPLESGGYELLCGNRRKRASELAGIETLPVIIRELDDDEAVIAVVDSNLEQREEILPSEKAWAYRVKMEALNHSGIKSESYSHSILSRQTNTSKNQIFRLIRLTELVPALLDRVDTKQLAFTPAVELSYLSRTEQSVVVDCMEKYAVKPSLSQAHRLKCLKRDGKLTEKIMDKILSEEKKPPQNEPTGFLRYRKYFPPEYSAKEAENVIIDLLQEWRSAQ